MQCAARPFICVGAAHWDLIGRAAAPLAPGGDVPGRVMRRPGGVALNVALALAGLGRASTLVAAVGRDPAGDDLVAMLSRHGVDCGAMSRRAGPTGSYVAIEDTAGALFAAVADCPDPDDVGSDLLASLSRLAAIPRVVVADGNLPAALLAHLAADCAGCDARFTVVAASPAKTPRLASLLATPALVLYLNLREAEALCGAALPDSRTAAARLLALGVAEAVVTDGAGEASHATAAGAVSLAPPRAAGGVTGAGDAFVAAHLAACEDGLAPEPALRAALDAGSRHLTREAP